uniref:F-box domain-containing protein n=1 Tax=Tetranychus urticae TaxID=32264 RepID=T1KN49_TETUR
MLTIFISKLLKKSPQDGGERKNHLFFNVKVRQYLVQFLQAIVSQLVNEFSYDYSSDCVYYEREDPIEGTCLRRLFRNLLLIAEISHAFLIKVEREVIVAFVRNQRFLRGVINFSDEQIKGYCGVLESIAGNHIMAYDMRNGPSIKQLYFGTYTPEVDLSYFPNLERHITSNEVPYSYYYGPVLEKLKIVELSCSSRYAAEISYGFQFMDSCPNLQSAHISINGQWITDKTLKHGSLQDVVIDFCNNDDFEWNDLSRLLMKYQNLKHLALWKQLHITDEHIKKLVHILPNLVLLDARECFSFYVQRICGRYERSIKFYFDVIADDIGLDWPQLSTKAEKISRGFNFMKHCFRKDFDDLSFFLAPIDNRKLHTYRCICYFVSHLFFLKAIKEP